MSEKDDERQPDGIEPRHIHEAGGTRLQTMPFGVVLLGLLIGASAIGVFGAEAVTTSADSGVELRVDAPIRIRNGEFYEMRITVTTDRAIGELVITVDPAVWHDTTVNTMIPAAAEEAVRDGAFAFTFGPLDAGERFELKVDAQVNPDHAPTANEGLIGTSDGEDTLASVSYRMEVLP